jgi:hypothetical protein
MASSLLLARAKDGKRLVGGSLFVKNFLQQAGGFLVAEQLGPFVEAAISRHFVVFNFLGGCDQRGIDRRRSIKGGGHFFALLQQSDGRIACFRFRLAVEAFENLLDFFGMTFGLFQVEPRMPF